MTNVVLLRVNGRDLTAQYVREKVELTFAKAMAYQGRVMDKGNAEKFNAFATMHFKRYIADFLIEGDVAAKGIPVEPVDVSNALFRLNHQMHCQCKDISQFKPVISNRFEMLSRAFDADCKVLAYLRKEEGFSAATDEDIDAYYVFLDQQNKRKREVDAQQWEKARDAAKAIREGLSWTNAVERFSEDKLDNRAEYGYDWGTWGLDTIPFQEMGKQIVLLKVGETSEPFETEDGILILRLMDQPAEGRYHLGRILFRLSESAPDRSRDEVRGILMEDNFRGAMNAAKKRLQKGVRFEYPLGTNCAYTIWQESPKKEKNAKRRTKVAE